MVSASLCDYCLFQAVLLACSLLSSLVTCPQTCAEYKTHLKGTVTGGGCRWPRACFLHFQFLPCSNFLPGTWAESFPPAKLYSGVQRHQKGSGMGCSCPWMAPDGPCFAGECVSHNEEGELRFLWGDLGMCTVQTCSSLASLSGAPFY